MEIPKTGDGIEDTGGGLSKELPYFLSLIKKCSLWSLFLLSLFFSLAQAINQLGRHGTSVSSCLATSLLF